MKILYFLFCFLFFFSFSNLTPGYVSDGIAQQNKNTNARVVAEGISISVPQAITEAVPFFVEITTDKPASVNILWNKKSVTYPHKKKGNSYSTLMMLVMPMNKYVPSAKLVVTVNGTNYMYAVNVVKEEYKTVRRSLPRRATIKDASRNAHIKKGLSERSRLLRTFIFTRYWEKDIWGSPVSRPASLLKGFGEATIYNTTKLVSHEALDFSGKIGDPIYSVAAGRVVYVGPFYFIGKTIYINHGYGIVSGYSSLDSYEVQVGKIVQAGERIGTMGRVTENHRVKLHFALFSLGEAINPTSLLNK